MIIRVDHDPQPIEAQDCRHLADISEALRFFKSGVRREFLPGQVANAIANHFDPTVYAAEALGLALARNTSFNTNF